MRSGPADDLYEADLEDDHPDQMWNAAAGPIFDGLRQRRYQGQSNLHEAPPPSFIPGRPEQSFGGGSSYSNMPHSEPRQMGRQEQQAADYFLIVRQLRNGSITGAFHLPRKIFLIAFIAVSLMVTTLLQFPDLWKFVFGLL
jgi:hypothetical protein